MTTCPCGSKKNYADCCQPFIELKKIPETPEQLMRSRYTAYTQANMDYIVRTMRGKAAADFDLPGSRQWATQSKWLGLTIVKSEIDKTNPKIGFVEFISRFRANDQEQMLHEASEFHHEHGHWYYVDGKETTTSHDPIRRETAKVGRNDPCPCGSGKKYKKCCCK